MGAGHECDRQVYTGMGAGHECDRQVYTGVGAGHEYDHELRLVSHLHHTLAEQTEVKNNA